MSYLSAELQQCLHEADDRRCAYCQTAETNTGHPMTVDHIMPRSLGGLTIFDNLCFACRSCNQFKGQTITAADPLTGKIVPLYHPRQQTWSKHFAWTESGILLMGLTEVGRATIIALKINNPVIVDARSRWVSVGWHPPGHD